MEIGPAFFSVMYTSPTASQAVSFAIVVPEPAPPAPNGSQSLPNFHLMDTRCTR
jgi:hypothetical protein